MPGRLATQTGAAKISAPVEHQHIQMVLNDFDERQECVTPGPATEKVVWCHVRCRYYHDRSLEQSLEQPPQDHSIYNIVDLELVEAQQGRTSCNFISQRSNRVVSVRIRLLPGKYTRMNLLHKSVEMDALLTVYAGFGKEEVHQHRFAPPYLAHEIQPIRTCWSFVHRTLPHQSADEASLLRLQRRIVVTQLCPQILQSLGGHGLSRVSCQLARC